MGRRLWHIALVAAALALGGAQQPEPKAQTEQQQAGEIEQASARIAEAIGQIGPGEDEGCPNRQDKRGSDLCAQWKAADAAGKAATATWWAVGLSFAGTVLVALTFFETLTTGRRQVRAYVSVTPRGLPVFAVGQIPCATITVRNGGVTPAYDVTQYGTVVVGEFPMPSDPLAGELDRQGIRGYTTLHQGDSHGAPIQAHKPLTQDEFDSIFAERKEGEPKRVVYVIGNAEYRDTFNKRRKTEFCYFLDAEAIRAAVKGEKAGQVTLRWTMGNMHTKAT